MGQPTRARTAIQPLHRWKGKQTVLFPSFRIQNGRFTKTGSGRTQQKHSKEGCFLAAHGCASRTARSRSSARPSPRHLVQRLCIAIRSVRSTQARRVRSAPIHLLGSVRQCVVAATPGANDSVVFRFLFLEEKYDHLPRQARDTKMKDVEFKVRVLLGTHSRACQQDGTWGGTAPALGCVAAGCVRPPANDYPCTSWDSGPAWRTPAGAMFTLAMIPLHNLQPVREKSFFAPLYTKNEHFTKTGSGQT